ncbi:MAG: oligopeptide/dipeptide ABC transporter ATP-binding protein, partial [bacterium]
DEPVSMVDASLRMSIVNLFKDLRDELQVSIIYVTHDLATAYYVSDRIAIMLRGNIVEQGPAREILDEPMHPYTKLLKESVPKPDPEDEWTDITDLTASLEKEEYAQKGCKFYSRCPYADPSCKNEIPTDYQLGNRTVRCFRFE